MADKISESSWTDFIRKHKLELDDKALVKALAAFGKTSESQPGPRLKALEELIEQLTKQIAAAAKRKKELGDKPFGELKDKLYELLDAAEHLQRDTLKNAQEEDGEEAESPALLTSKMIPLVRDLKKGDVRMQVLIGSISKAASVLISRRSISAARRKLLNEALDATGGVKFAKGECYYEKGTLYFVLEGQVGGLAKRVRAAMLEQTGFRLKIGMRGDDGEEAEGHEEDEEGEDAAAEHQGDKADAGTTASSTAPTPPDPAQLAYIQQLRKLQEPLDKALAARHAESSKLRALIGFASEKADEAHDYPAAIKALKMVEQLLDATAAAPEKKEGVPALDAFTARLAALMPHIKQALAAGGPAGPDIKAKVAEAGVLARQGHLEQAQALLDALEALLGRGTGSTSTPTGAREGEPHPGIVSYRKALLAWDGAKKKARADIQKLRAELMKQRPGHAEAADALNHALDALNAGLADQIDKAMSASKDGQRLRHQAAALKLALNYRSFLEGDAMIEDIDDNPLDVKVDAGKTLLDGLAEVITSLEAAKRATA